MVFIFLKNWGLQQKVYFNFKHVVFTFFFYLSSWLAWQEQPSQEPTQGVSYKLLWSYKSRGPEKVISASTWPLNN